jgi:hypothetical protein
MLIFLGILTYLAVVAGFCLWDAFIGMPVEWDPNMNNNIPCWLGALLWPFAIPVICVIGFSKFLDKVREKRAQREEKIERLRIVAEREKKKAEEEEIRLLEEAQEELANETEDSHSTRFV